MCLILWVANCDKSNKSGLAQQSILMYYVTKGTTKLQTQKHLFLRPATEHNFLGPLYLSACTMWGNINLFSECASCYVFFGTLYHRWLNGPTCCSDILILLTNIQKHNLEIYFFIKHTEKMYQYLLKTRPNPWTYNNDNGLVEPGSTNRLFLKLKKT